MLFEPGIWLGWGKFGKLIHGGEVMVHLKDDAMVFEVTAAPPKKGKKRVKVAAGV